jgi:hypothetical protein
MALLGKMGYPTELKALGIFSSPHLDFPILPLNQKFGTRFPNFS